MRWVFLSPHFDDVVLSCGGMIWDQVQAGLAVEVWTVCAGTPDPALGLSAFAAALHQRWGTGLEAVGERWKEDEAALRRLGAQARYWDLPDCIYRRLPDGAWLVNGEDELWQPIHGQEREMVHQLAAWFAAGLQPADRLVSPLTLGNHVDHRLVRAAAEELGLPLWYYPDYPYAIHPQGGLEGKTGIGWKKHCTPVSPAALLAWQEAVGCYTSQLSTFWGSRLEMEAAMEDYWQAGGGACLWQPPASAG